MQRIVCHSSQTDWRSHYGDLVKRYPDPLAERRPDQSPYAHCANNPVRFIDPTGRVLEYPSSPSNMSFNYKMRDVRAYVGTDIKEIEEKLRNSPHHFMVFDANREGGGNRIRTILKLFRK